ncbi:hypothetical protein QAD02_022975 [Eretmocerus hayati]|uniref:Uncharacterized protein n=1 Tax=Eretmocerus hayati TaxID=131215 RepID=A0ACC2PW63_9HYME|nr:hypothetical protein QAD02_022975 [Eretmocerus hayati]
MSGEEEEVTMIECPVCAKEFTTLLIENHVTSCLFLNDSTSENKGSSKRLSVSRDEDRASKKSKQDENNLSQSNLRSPNANYSQSPHRNRMQNSGFDKQRKQNASMPLAERMRPDDIISYIGQPHVLAPGTMLYQLLTKNEIPNIILWGPPGCGKTSLANVIGNICKTSPTVKYRFVKLSAAMSGVSDVKEAVTIASNELKFGRRTVMFMDEIHRFNKTQQDIFLPHVESGTITLIGATTENPSFSLNAALLSRCRVIVLEKLSVEDLKSILENAVKAVGGFICDSPKEKQAYQRMKKENYEFLIEKNAIEWLAETSDGDARIALGGLELAIQSSSPDGDQSAGISKCIALDDIKEGLKKSHMLYDKKGEQHYDMISALHKSIRASDENASLYWLTRMISGGEDPVYIARRLLRAASEDVGLEDPKALGIAVQTMQACKMLGMPECDVLLAHCTTYLARAPKSRLMEDSLRAAQRLVANYKGAQPSVPLHLRNAPTKLMKDLGYGKNYNMLSKDESGLKYLPDEIQNVNFFSQE